MGSEEASAGLDDAKEAAIASATVQVLLVCVLLNVGCACVINPIRPALVTDLLRNEAATSMALARMTACGALSEFLFNPVFGRLSDRFGRKPFIAGALACSALADATLFFRKSSVFWLLFERCVVVTADTVFFTTARAALTDVLRGAELTVSASRVALAAGFGVMAGPVLSARLLAGRRRLCFGLNACVLASTACYAALALPETLATEKRRPMDWSRAHPFNFFKILVSSPSMFWLMLCSWLQTTIDGRNIFESNFMYMRDQLKFAQEDLANYMSFGGVKIMIGGALGKPFMRWFGQLGITSVSNAINFVAQALGMLAQGTRGIYLHVLATGIGERKRDGVETLMTGEAGRLGFGRGETAAGLANWRSIANIVAPLVFARAYNWGITPPRHFPAAIFLVRMIIGTVIPELAFRAVPLAERRRMVAQA